MWNLLVVEDEAIVRIGLRVMLDWEALGIAWKAEAANGTEALRAALQEDIHIVMTDIRMPGMDGLELARRLKEQAPHIQIIFFSSFDDFPYVKEAVKLGAVDYLHKPTMEEAEIEAALRKAAVNLEQTAAAPAVPLAEDREAFLLKLLEEDNAAGSAEADWNRYDPDSLYSSGFRLILIRPEQENEDGAEANPSSSFISFRYFVEEHAARQSGGLILARERELIWLLPGGAGAGMPKPSDEELEQLDRELGKLLNIRMVYARSEPFVSILDLRLAYRQAAELLCAGGRVGGIVRMAMRFVEEHLLEEVTLSKTADHIHVSVSHLSRIFLKETGRHFSEYVTAKKIERAKQLLRDSNLKVYEIAEELGYANSHYFGKLFKEVTGYTPVEYRNR